MSTPGVEDKGQHSRPRPLFQSLPRPLAGLYVSASSAILGEIPLGSLPNLVHPPLSLNHPEAT